MWAPAKIPMMRLGQFDPLPPMEPLQPIERSQPLPSMPASQSFNTQDEAPFFKSDTTRTIFWALDVASMAASTYHGYKRNNSVGWAIWWGLMGSLFPVITPVIAVAQGFGKPIKK